MSHVQQSEAHRNQFFANIYQFVVITAHTQMPRTQDLAIFVMTTDDRQTKPIALPLADARGVKMMYEIEKKQLLLYYNYYSYAH